MHETNTRLTSAFSLLRRPQEISVFCVNEANNQICYSMCFLYGTLLKSILFCTSTRKMKAEYEAGVITAHSCLLRSLLAAATGSYNGKSIFSPKDKNERWIPTEKI